MYLATWRVAKLGTFTHFTFTNLSWCSQSINTLIHAYSLQISSCILWVLDHSCDHTSSYYCRWKKISVLPPDYKTNESNLSLIWSNSSLIFLCIVKSVCVFSHHFRVQAWSFVKSIIKTQRVKFGSDPKILPPNVHFTDQTAGAMGKKEIFLGFHFPKAYWKVHVLQIKCHTFIFCFKS